MSCEIVRFQKIYVIVVLCGKKKNLILCYNINYKYKSPALKFKGCTENK